MKKCMLHNLRVLLIQFILNMCINLIKHYTGSSKLLELSMNGSLSTLITRGILEVVLIRHYLLINLKWIWLLHKYMLMISYLVDFWRSWSIILLILCNLNLKWSWLGSCPFSLGFTISKRKRESLYHKRNMLGILLKSLALINPNKRGLQLLHWVGCS